MRDKKLIQLYLTNRCNSRCKTCPIWKITEKEDLPLDTVKEIILANKDADFVYGGGEFFLYPYYEELIDWSEQNNINYTILTNGLLPDKVYPIASKYAPNFTISWDGIKHDDIRGIPNNSDKIKFLVKYIKRCGGGIKLSYTFSKFNYDTIDEDMRVIKDVFEMNKVYLALGRDSDTFANKDELVAPKDYYPLLRHLDMFYTRDVLFLSSWAGGDIKPCDSTKYVITIYSNGDVPLCQGIESDKKWGNIFEDGIEAIMNRIEELHPIYCPYSKVCYSLCQRRYDYEVK